MHVLVSGATGLVGSVLLPQLRSGGHTVSVLTRAKAVEGARSIAWDPAQGKLDAASLEGVEAIVHLAGESIIGRWTEAKKARIKESRVSGTSLLAAAASRMSRPPYVFISASAVGYYGDRSGEVLTEESPAGSGFLSEVCQVWEQATAAASSAGIRTVLLRIGIVLSRKGGALAAMLPPFQLGIGGPLGSGRQWWSWIAIDDIIGIIQHALRDERLRGPVNAVAPEPCTNGEFARALGRALHRPAFLPVPRFAPKLLVGEMADALLFASARVLPQELQAGGYAFRFSSLDEALRHVLTA